MNCGIIWQSQVTIPYHQNIYKYYILPLLAATNWPQTHHPSLVPKAGSKPWKPRWKWWWPKFGPFSQRCVLLKTPIYYSKGGGFVCWVFSVACWVTIFLGARKSSRCLLQSYHFQIFLGSLLLSNFGHVWILPITKQHHKFWYHRNFPPKYLGVFNWWIFVSST